MIELKKVLFLDYLRSSGYITSFLENYLLDYLLDSVPLPPDMEKRIFNEYLQDQKLTTDQSLHDHLSSTYLTDKLLKSKLFRPYRLIQFRELKWGNFVNSLYLKRKDEFDAVFFNMVRTRIPNIMQEIYFRLKDGEETWEAICRQLNSDNPEIKALHGPAYQGQFSPELISHLLEYGVGVISPPTQIGSWFVISRLEKIIPSQLDEKIRAVLLRDQFDSWFSDQKAIAMENIEFMNDTISVALPPEIEASQYL